MPGKAHRFGLLRDVAIYSGVVVFCLLFLYRVLDLRNADIHVPFLYSGDALLTSLPIKGIIDHGWYLENPSLAAPGVHQLYDYPFGEIFFFVCFKVMSLFTKSFGTILNLFYLLSFPATAVTSLLVFRRLGYSYPPAIAGSLLFACQPYHFWRGESHLYVGTYFVVPLVMLVVLWVGADKPPFLNWKPSRQSVSSDTTSESTGVQEWRPASAFYGAIAICLWLSWCGFYYAFFAGFFLFVAGAIAALRRRTLSPVIVAVALAVTLIVGMVLTTAPAQLYWRKEGKNTIVARRVPEEAEVFGLKIVQLLLPIDGHRVTRLDETKRWYNERTPLTNENRASALGAVGSAGFLFLVVCLFLPESLLVRLPSPIRLLSQLNLFSLLFATIGGFSMVFAMKITPQIRAYNRISIFIAFFSICALVTLADVLYRRYRDSTRFRVGFVAVLAIVVLGALLDQTGYLFRPKHGMMRNEYSSDDHFVKRIEATVAPNAMIFQLPYVTFPESAPMNQMSDYDHLRGYMHSKQLRWSYGAMRGRKEDDEQKQISSKPVPELVKTLRGIGFAGIYIDRAGYKDSAKALEAKLNRVLGTKGPLIESEDKRLVFYLLTSPKG